VLHPRDQYVWAKWGNLKSRTVENGACSIDRVTITKGSRETNGHGRTVASKEMRNKLDAEGEVQRMTKEDREDREGREENRYGRDGWSRV